ncbi:MULTISPECIES: DEAD/DEAH box helicase [Asticcacaulis]|uniref:DEAD/DEAH box helicase n=1 Tax=Asticcacaulis TaxID=76890 RepID=UPI001AE76648|nr:MULTISPECIES: DEAD/DEAH box helicase [Asticcacaulis]MBP2159131.1 hypothetical protein [Asticcacaulis solisilvae]MDR6800176.1 hypothetical protein [Asticcacaulis sp. BE141]
MTIDELRSWLLSTDGLKDELELLARLSAAKSLQISSLRLPLDISEFEPNWQRLLLGASILAQGQDTLANDAALLISHAGLLCSNRPEVRDACGLILGQLSNSRAVKLAENRGLIADGLEDRVGTIEQMLTARREITQSIYLTNAETIKANTFQRAFWDGLEQAQWTSASAPTASGKTYLVLQWLLKEFAYRRATLAVFIAPTRALVGEIERELLDLANAQNLHDIRVSSLPLAALGDRQKPTILVFTQERLHIFLNGLSTPPGFDIVVVDEAQKIGDGLRGVILQDAIERLERLSDRTRFIFLSPLTENPEHLLSDAPDGSVVSVVPSDTSTVTQNLIVAEQRPRKSDEWRLLLYRDAIVSPVGEFYLHDRPDNIRKRISYVALAIGREQSGTLVYANGADEAEKLAWQIYDGLGDSFALGDEAKTELLELSSFARDTVHPDFQLVDLVKRGVAFHYGNMPSLLRSEIERLFTKGTIRFLVCTSTLIEGVNLACRTIIVRGPRKGNNKPMGAHDFWNLAGRAGRWGKDFHGNIVCIDVNRADAWPTGTPRKVRYPIKRETEQVLAANNELLPYLENRLDLSVAGLNPRLEQVVAYLLSWHIRTGSFLNSPSATRLEVEYATQLNTALTQIAATIDLPMEILTRHSGVSAIALQTLLNSFRAYEGPVENLLPSDPGSDDAVDQFAIVFDRIERFLFPAFSPPILLHALVTVEWIRGLPLGQIIKNRISYAARHSRADNIPKIIRDTMKEVEEFARFRVPKYLSAYLDVIRFHMHEVGKAELFPADLKFDLYLEYGVATKTLLSLIGIGLSRTSAIAINEYLASNDLDETAVIERLIDRRWRTLAIPSVVKREIERVLAQRSRIQLAG